eukprot:SM000123S25873  [mRNA]  locus=s123:343886:346711:- [translate_table: standard]
MDPARTPSRSAARPPALLCGDRFIPARDAGDASAAQYNFLRTALDTSLAECCTTPIREEYRKKLAENVFGFADSCVSPPGGAPTKVLAFRSKPPVFLDGPSSARLLHPADVQPLPLPAPRTTPVRRLKERPDLILDLPLIKDDFYINVLDWSSTNVVAVAMEGVVHLWNCNNGEVHEIAACLADDYVSSLAWARDGKTIAIGLGSTEIQLWNTSPMRQVRRLVGHRARVGSLAWNEHMLSSGGCDALIYNHDVRSREHRTSELTGHHQEICGLRWSASGRHLASGGNDNLVHIWDIAAATGRGTTGYLHRFADHHAGVKALAWCPFQSNLVATGGGTADRCIKFWNTHSGTCLDSIDTDAQVCGLLWDKHRKELLSAHGFSKNQLCLWKYPSMVRIAELTGHTNRVLHITQDPSSGRVATAAADETLRVWNVFATPEKSSTKPERDGQLTPGGVHVRCIR